MSRRSPRSVIVVNYSRHSASKARLCPSDVSTGPCPPSDSRCGVTLRDLIEREGEGS